MKNYFFLCLLLNVQLVAAVSYKLTSPPYNPGFFSVFNTVVGILDEYDTHPEIDGLEIDFEDGGLFFDTNYGSNWWGYYFEPITLGVVTPHAARFPTYKKVVSSIRAQFDLPKIRYKELCDTYIKIKPHIREKVELFYTAHFNDKNVVGIHYRGTDKKVEAPVVSYAYVTELLEQEPQDTLFFVATDDALFLEHMQNHFTGRVCAIDAQRSSDDNPLHHPPTDHMYEIGEQALIDCLLLSRCSKLYKTASNLSDAAAKLNPCIPVIDLNESFSQSKSAQAYNPFKAINLVLSLLDKQDVEGNVFLPIDGEKYPGKEGNNWWEYYFEPLVIGANTANIELANYEQTTRGLLALFEMDKERAHDLIKKNIKIRAAIHHKVSEFVGENFEFRYVLGINVIKQNRTWLRPTMSNEQLFSYLDCEVPRLPVDHVLFVNTNDAELLDQLKNKYHNVVCLGIDPLGDQNDQLSQEEKDERLLMTCLLFARAHKVAGTSTELLKCAQQFNPDLCVEELDVFWLLSE